jgi:hypothetical protein
MEKKLMQILRKLLSPVFMLVTGVALGLGAANYFAVADNDGKEIASTPMSTLQETAVTTEAAETNVLSIATNVPIKPVANIAPQTQDSAANNTISEDVSLSETVDASRQETAITEPSPEELAYNHPLDYVATPALGLQETDQLENKLRLESANTAPIPLDGNGGLPGHEML